MTRIILRVNHLVHVIHKVLDNHLHYGRQWLASYLFSSLNSSPSPSSMDGDCCTSWLWRLSTTISSKIILDKKNSNRTLYCHKFQLHFWKQENLDIILSASTQEGIALKKMVHSTLVIQAKTSLWRSKALLDFSLRLLNEYLLVSRLEKTYWSNASGVCEFQREIENTSNSASLVPSDVSHA
jgi:hypothetical protein